MYATIRHYAGNPAFADALAARRNEVLDVVQSVDGFRAYYLIRTAGGTVSVTVCDSPGGAEETNRLAANWVRQNMPEAASSPPEVTVGEVVITG